MNPQLASLARRALSMAVRTARRQAQRQAGGQAGGQGGRQRRADPAGNSYPGDFTGIPQFSYSPDLDGDPDCGEVVWTWVPYEEDHSQGKDRPVLLIGTDAPYLLAVQLTSKDHGRDEAQERRAGRLWMDLGSGPWDSRGRPSEVRLNRIIRIDPAQVRREGAILDRERFDRVTEAVRAALS
ncbi:type II toxin-antitoxin system PemK/MazF family toxin [Dermacoccaceae bacterium W4C1]